MRIQFMTILCIVFPVALAMFFDVASSTVCRLPKSTQALLSSAPAPHFVSNLPAVQQESGMAAFCGAGSDRCCQGRVSRQRVEIELHLSYVQQLRHHLYTSGAATLQSANHALQDWQSAAFHSIVESVAYPAVLSSHHHIIKTAAKHFCLLPFDAVPACNNVQLFKKQVETFLSRLYVKILIASNFSHVSTPTEATQQCITKHFAQSFLKSDIGKLLVNDLLCATKALVCEPEMVIESITAAKELLVAVSRHEPTHSCLKGLARLWHCPYCSGQVHASTPPCNGLCLNVVRGCLGNIKQVSDVYTPVMLMLQDRLSWLNRNRHKLVSNAAKIITHFITAVYRTTLNPRKIDQVQLTCGALQGNSDASRSSFELGCSPGSGSQTLSAVLKKSPLLLGNKFQFLDLFMAHDLCQLGTGNSACHNGRTNGSYTKPLVSADGVAQRLNPEVRVHRDDDRYQHEIAAFQMAVEQITRRNQHTAPGSSNTGGASQLIIETSGWGEGIMVDDEDSNPTGSASGSGLPLTQESSWSICDRYIEQPSAAAPQPNPIQARTTPNDPQSVTELLWSTSPTTVTTQPVQQSSSLPKPSSHILWHTSALIRPTSAPPRSTLAPPRHAPWPTVPKQTSPAIKRTPLPSKHTPTMIRNMPSTQLKEHPPTKVMTKVTATQQVDLEKSSAFLPQIHLCLLLVSTLVTYAIPYL